MGFNWDQLSVMSSTDLNIVEQRILKTRPDRFFLLMFSEKRGSITAGLWYDSSPARKYIHMVIAIFDNLYNTRTIYRTMPNYDARNHG